MITAPSPRYERDLDRLFRRLGETNGREVRDAIVERFQPLVRALARRYISSAEPFDDLVQVANLGLLKAVERFDSRRGTTFRAFAVPTILGELKRHFRDCGWSVHVTRSAQNLALKVHHAQRELENSTGRGASLSALAEYLEIPVEDVAEGLATASLHHAISLDGPYDPDEDGSTLHDHLGGDDPGFGLSDARFTISSLTAELPPLERQVLVLRFARELTQAEIGVRVGVSQMQVSRILRRALERTHERSMLFMTADENSGGEAAGQG
jgi:RNA polymerase sigma-B factor